MRQHDPPLGPAGIIMGLLQALGWLVVLTLVTIAASSGCTEPSPVGAPVSFKGRTVDLKGGLTLLDSASADSATVYTAAFLFIDTDHDPANGFDVWTGSIFNYKFDRSATFSWQAGEGDEITAEGIATVVIDTLTVHPRRRGDEFEDKELGP